MKELEEKIKELKAEAYDALVIIEQTKARLNALNNQIANISQQPEQQPPQQKKQRLLNKNNT